MLSVETATSLSWASAGTSVSHHCTGRYHKIVCLLPSYASSPCQGRGTAKRHRQQSNPPPRPRPPRLRRGIEVTHGSQGGRRGAGQYFAAMKYHLQEAPVGLDIRCFPVPPLHRVCAPRVRGANTGPITIPHLYCAEHLCLPIAHCAIALEAAH